MTEAINWYDVDNGYAFSMECAGATVHAFEEFGSYQGDWWARVTHNGVTGFVTGSYGSCSGCDAFQAEFFTVSDDKTTKADFAAFGAPYLEDIMTKEQALKEASRHVSWDLEAEEMVKWIEAQ